MKSNILSNVVSLKEAPGYLEFCLAFIDKGGEHHEYIFFDSTISQCVIKTIGFVNFMFRIKGMKMVYIFPTNSPSYYRNIYRRGEGEDGRYKIVRCHPDIQMDLFLAMGKWHENE